MVVGTGCQLFLHRLAMWKRGATDVIRFPFDSFQKLYRTLRWWRRSYLYTQVDCISWCCQEIGFAHLIISIYSHISHILKFDMMPSLGNCLEMTFPSENSIVIKVNLIVKNGLELDLTDYSCSVASSLVLLLISSKTTDGDMSCCC
jgi:hypothetical protein